MNVVYAGATDLAARLPYAHFLATFYGPIGHRSRLDLDEIDYGIGHGVGKTLRGCVSRPLFGHAIAVDASRQALLDEAAALLSDAGPVRVPAGMGGHRG
jgi:hypothetical protein